VQTPSLFPSHITAQILPEFLKERERLSATRCTKVFCGMLLLWYERSRGGDGKCGTNLGRACFHIAFHDLISFCILGRVSGAECGNALILVRRLRI
jgi:hypothetical protein